MWKTNCWKSWRILLWEFWEVGVLERRACQGICSKTQFEFWKRILQQKNNIFPFMGILSLKVTSATKWYLLKMCHLKHRSRIFLFCRKIMFRSQDIQVFVFLTIPWFTKLVTSRWVLVHEIRCIFEYIFWTTNYEVTKLGQLIDISNYNNFQ